MLTVEAAWSYTPPLPKAKCQWWAGETWPRLIRPPWTGARTTTCSPSTSRSSSTQSPMCSSWWCRPSWWGYTDPMLIDAVQESMWSGPFWLSWEPVPHTSTPPLVWWVRSALPPVWKSDPEGRRKFSKLIISFSFISTFLGFLQPAVNAPCLLLLGIPAFILMVMQLKVEEDDRVISLGKRSIFFWVLAVTCWINDKVFCDVWVSVGFPYLHGVWHILIFLASYTAIVLFAYFEVKNHMPWETPKLRYYPVDDFQLGIPYVHIEFTNGNGKEYINGNGKEYNNGNGKNHEI